ncbi:MAG: serine hydrolase domain-containing protein [Melioribacteraceae bacterium]|nr:serine hydrolase domain-containing protein [Melioribacteraceae bacterium]
MKITSLLFLGIIGIMEIGFSQSNFDFTPIENQINKEISNGTIPSISIAIAKDGKIIFEKAFGWADINANIKATINTSYQLASASKPMTATGLMVLNHKNIVDIDSSANSYMDPLKFQIYEGKVSDVKLRKSFKSYFRFRYLL